MINFVVVGIIAVIFAAAVVYIVKEKKRGVKCIGCPAAGTCASGNNVNTECSCGCQSE